MTARGGPALAYAFHMLSRGEMLKYSELEGFISESTYRNIVDSAKKLKLNACLSSRYLVDLQVKPYHNASPSSIWYTAFVDIYV